MAKFLFPTDYKEILEPIVNGDILDYDLIPYLNNLYIKYEADNPNFYTNMLMAVNNYAIEKHLSDEWTIDEVRMLWNKMDKWFMHLISEEFIVSEAIRNLIKEEKTVRKLNKTYPPTKNRTKNKESAPEPQLTSEQSDEVTKIIKFSDLFIDKVSAENILNRLREEKIISETHVWLSGLKALNMATLYVTLLKKGYIKSTNFSGKEIANAFNHTFNTDIGGKNFQPTELDKILKNEGLMDKFNWITNYKPKN